MKIFHSENMVATINSLIRILFSLTLFSVLFLPWYLAFMGPHPDDLPLSGWNLLLISAYFLGVLLQAREYSFLMIVVVSTLALWGAPFLSLLNLLLATRYRKLLTKINLVSLTFFVSTTIGTVVLFRFERLSSVLLFGFWFYLILLFVIIIYEIAVRATIKI